MVPLTSPNQPKPGPTSDQYDDVHSVGSSFGQDLTESSVRTMLMSQGKSPFQQALDNFVGAIGGLISGIANAITGGGGAQFSEIAGAVETRLGPINTMITESAERHQDLAEQVESNSTEQAAINQSIQDEHQRRWNELQGETNHLVQEQLWQHQDMIELLDIRAPKTYGWIHGQFPSTATCPWANDPSEVYQYASTPYIEVWSTVNTTYVACRGDWVGSYEVTVNWDNGAVDNWVHTITSGGSRVGRFTGGASHIDKRHVTITVYPRSLMRKAEMTVNAAGTEWYKHQLPPTDLVRYYSGDVLRLRNAATCTSAVVIQNEEGVLETIPAGQTIPTTELRSSEQPRKNFTYSFTEIDDPSVNYTFPTPRATGSRTEFEN